ncbi:MAG: MlaD family protein [Gammaproteobacteria bacterium]|nr:MlaD family protein [Gammaproteobacteria bacterium]
MSKHASPTLIGAFVAGAIGLIVAGILIISGGKLLLTDKTSYVLYFQGSVKGLNIGSPVSFRGVNIGTVTDIQLVVGEEEADIQIPVIIEIDNTKFISSQTGESKMDDDDSIKDLVKAGMRAQLQLQSLLTGQLFIQIDFYPNTPVKLAGSGKNRSHYQEIPTIPTPIEKIGKLLETIPLDTLVDTMLATINGIEKLVNSDDLHHTIRSLHEALDSFRTLANNLDRQVEPVAANVNLTLDDARSALQNVGVVLDDAHSALQNVGVVLEGVGGTMEQANVTLQSADELFSNEQILTALDNALNEIKTAAYAIRILAETINNQPESLLRGRR